MKPWLIAALFLLALPGLSACSWFHKPIGSDYHPEAAGGAPAAKPAQAASKSDDNLTDPTWWNSPTGNLGDSTPSSWMHDNGYE